MSRSDQGLMRPFADKKNKSKFIEAKELRMCNSANMALCAYTDFLIGEANEEIVHQWIDKVSSLGQNPEYHPLTDQDQKALHCVNKINAQMLAKAEDEKQLRLQQILDQQRLQQMSKLLALVSPKDKKKAVVKIDTAVVKVILMPTPARVKAVSAPKRAKRITTNTPVSNNSGASTPVNSY